MTASAASRAQFFGILLLLVAAVYAGWTARTGPPAAGTGRLSVARESPLQHRAVYDDASMFVYFAEILQARDPSALFALRRHASFQPIVRNLADQLTTTVDELSVGAETVDRALSAAAALLRANRRPEATALLTQADDRLRRDRAALRRGLALLGEMGARLQIGDRPGSDPARLALARVQQTLARLDARQRRSAIALADLRTGRITALGTFRTVVRVAFPHQSYIGRPLTVEGAVVTQGPAGNPPRRVSVALDGRVVGSITSHGPFKLAFVPPPDFPVGWHRLSVQISPQNGYPEAVDEGSVELVQAPIRVHLQPIGVAWLPGAVVVSGDAAPEFGLLAGAKVEARLGDTGSGVAGTTPSGTFRVRIAPSPTTGFLGDEPVTVRVVPVEAWNAPLTVVTHVFVVNFLRLGLTAGVGFVLVAAYGWTQRRRPEDTSVAASRSAGTTRSPASTAWTAASGDSVPMFAPAPAVEVPSGTVLAVYLDALHHVEERTGVRSLPSWTLREFLRASAARRRSPVFAQMTEVTEAALYASRSDSKEFLPAMLRLRQALADELGHANA